VKKMASTATERSGKFENTRKTAHEKVDSLMDRTEDYAQRGADQLTSMQEKATQVRETVDTYVKDNPEKSVLIAAGAGAVVGALLAAALMRRR
jgi:ElaB/YqjD/DUF883 family membrane-anchored ribosome-binding protein